MNSEHPHTPGRLHVLNGTDVFTDLGATNASGVTADENDGWQIASLSGGLTSVDSVLESMDYKECQANASRMVACWNACDGIPTEILEKVLGKRETIGSDFMQMHAENKAITEQNRELLEALNGLFWRVDNMMPWDRQEPLNTMMINARAAIAKATNQTT